MWCAGIKLNSNSLKGNNPNNDVVGPRDLLDIRLHGGGTLMLIW